MPKKNAAIATAVVVAAAAAGVIVGKSIAANKVIIITDGSVRAHAGVEDNFKETPASSGKKYKWIAKADTVAVWDCKPGQGNATPFTSVTVTVKKGSTPVVDLVFRNENRKLHASFGSPYKFEWTGAWHELVPEVTIDPSDLSIQKVVVDGKSIELGVKTCIRFTDD